MLDGNTEVWDLVGIILLLVFGYLTVTRLFLPQFALPWFGRKTREAALERANQMLEDTELDEEARLRLLRCRNTLRAYDTQPREQWSGSLPINDVVKEVDELWENRTTTRT